MVSKAPFYFAVLVLIVVGIVMSIVRHQTYGVPWIPGETRQIWDIEATIEFTARGGSVRASLAAPNTQSGFTLINESASSPGYGVSFLDGQDQRRVEWSIREAIGPQTIYYRTQFLVDENANSNESPPAGEFPQPNLPGPEISAGQALVQQARERSADNLSFTRELIKAINDPESQNSSLVLHSTSKVNALYILLSMAEIHSRVVGVIELEDGRRRQDIQSMIEVWSGSDWQLFSPLAQEISSTDNLLIWDQSNVSLIDIVGGSNSSTTFSMIVRNISATEATSSKVEADGLLNFSIHSLPLAEQAMFQTIMMIPIGALIVVFLRVIIGIKTSGTFMPVLIAVAFVQTQLLTGIVGFLLIVGTGLFIRSYLSRLNLLLVARISAVIIAVILIISMFTVVAFKIGLTEGLSITFFPMIILSWTIERMSILWEEEGAKEVMMQGGGSLLTAVLVYLAMTNEYLQHVTFNFIGIQLIVLAIILVLGTYTGYRLTELRRFKPLTKD